jgi:hypothetical protein
MSSLADLSGVVDVVIGVDTHLHSRSAAVETGTGGVLGEITVAAAPPRTPAGPGGRSQTELFGVARSTIHGAVRRESTASCKEVPD